MSTRLSDRVAGAIILALAIFIWVQSATYTVVYGDPAGPSLFPRAIALPMGLFALFLIARPDPDPVWLRWPHVIGQVATLVILIVYPLVIDDIGFPLSTTIAGGLMSRILGGTWLQSVVCGLAMGFGLFFLFDIVFGLPLPVGPIFG